ncbi:MAG: helicase-related protein [Flavobacteriaceae bacterium]|nr:helicase-related protein [Flavobacteriaceae bacterium]MCY4267577.1 helicase-related protein [Flavobacteriaceae bacterium]
MKKNKLDIHTKKRDSLEKFIKEQVIGPGVCGYRFVDTFDKNISETDLRKKTPLENNFELLDSVPGAYYSSGVLFPEDHSIDNPYGVNSSDKNELYEKNDEYEEDDSSTEIDDDQRNSIPPSQRFPRMIGITYCLDQQAFYSNKLEFEVAFRYYEKVSTKKAEFQKRYGVLCEMDDVKAFKKFLETYGFNNKNQNDDQLKIEKDLTSESSNQKKENPPKINTDTQSKDVKKSMLYVKSVGLNHVLMCTNLFMSKEIYESIKETQKDIAWRIFNKVKQIESFNYQGITKDNCYLSNLKSRIFRDLESNVEKVVTRKKLYDVSQEIELFENYFGHIINLLTINSESGYGLWKSNKIRRTIQIENVDANATKSFLMYNRKSPSGTKITVKEKSGIITNSLSHIFKKNLAKDKKNYASLSVNVQITRSTNESENNRFVRIQLVNTSTAFNSIENSSHYSTFSERVNKKSFFGIKIKVQSEFVRPYDSVIQNHNNDEFDQEEITNGILYKKVKNYGMGHGCSVTWSDGKIKSVESEFLPQSATPIIEHYPRNLNSEVIETSKGRYEDSLYFEDSRFLQFKWLSDLSNISNNQVIKGLREFILTYNKWIQSKKKIFNSKNELKELNKCEEDFNRMESNVVKFLQGPKNKENIDSFRLMNRSMFMQLWHSVNSKKENVVPLMETPQFDGFHASFYKKVEDKLFSKTKAISWRPFQLAFILLNLDGVFRSSNKEEWKERNQQVDLVWFPTGGGKTESYFGLIALTIINRRKEFHENGGGTAVIMRYTLRLLTLQQFQRATLLIMALELCRRWKPNKLGKEPITIGLWVGDSSIPNSTDDLIDEFKKFNTTPPKQNKIPLLNCPWCGSRLEANEKKENAQKVYCNNRVHLKCTSIKCAFAYSLRPSKRKDYQGPLPVSLSDEIIYQHPPSLLLATVDKFAQLAHKISSKKVNKDSRRIFGRGNWEKGKPQKGYIPPDLIIQDELHLLLGPLGSAVALFESAVDQLCIREDGTRPKIISSTATTRNTKIQTRVLFDRRVNIFPKPGVEYDDSFFAYQKREYHDSRRNRVDKKSLRKYIGVMATGRSQTWMQVRIAAIILCHRALFEIKELGQKGPIDFDTYQKDFRNVMDYYHTTVSYFNSLKEVGKTQAQLHSFLIREVRRVFNRVIRPQKLMQCIYTYYIKGSELTGRLTGKDVKAELQNLSISWNEEQRFKSKNKESYKIPEYVTATNMISVGVDISRFNTMIMNSMPRNLAEYIQATSRVARDQSGLVVTVHNPYRARDVSHFEKFKEFHQKMYTHVEPISITPFTIKSLKRYFGLYLITIIRHKGFSSNIRFVDRESASEFVDFNQKHIDGFVSELMRYFRNRRDNLSSSGNDMQHLLSEYFLEETEKTIEKMLIDWKKRCKYANENNFKLVFNNKSHITKKVTQEQLYVDIDEYEENIHSKYWQIPMSLRVIEPEALIRIKL